MKNHFDRDKVLVRKWMFTVMAKDNIDLNAKSTMITSHYHGTSASVFQYSPENNPGITMDHLFENDIHSSKDFLRNTLM